MAIISKEEIIKKVNDLLGDNSDDESLAFLENVTDTLSDYEKKISDSGDWKTRYEENDKEWRKKYRERFTQPVDSSEPDDIEDEQKEEIKTTFDELFEVKK